MRSNFDGWVDLALVRRSLFLAGMLIFIARAAPLAAQGLTAQISTERGCGDNVVYQTGEVLTVLFRIDGADPVDAEIDGVFADGRVIPIFQGVVPGNQDIEQPIAIIGGVTGRRAVRLSAQAGNLTANPVQCSFVVGSLPPPTPPTPPPPPSPPMPPAGTYPGVPLFNSFAFQGAAAPQCGGATLPLSPFPFQTGTGATRVVVEGPTSFIAAQNLGDSFDQIGVLFLDGDVPLGAVCSGVLLPGSSFVIPPAQLPQGTKRVIAYSFKTPDEPCSALLAVTTASAFAAFDAKYPGGARRSPIGVVAQTATGFFSNGAHTPGNLLGLPLVARDLNGQGLGTQILLSRPGGTGTLPVALYYYDDAGLHSFLCVALGPGQQTAIDLANNPVFPPGWVGSFIVATFGKEGILADVKPAAGTDLNTFLNLPASPGMVDGRITSNLQSHPELMGNYDPVNGGYEYYLFPVSETSTVTIANLGTPAPTAVEIWAYPFESGNPLLSRQIASLAAAPSATVPGQAVNVSVAALTQGVLASFQGYLRVRASQPLLVSAGNPAWGQVTAVPAELAFVPGGQPFFTVGASQLQRSGLPGGSDLLIAVQDLDPLLDAQVTVEVQRNGQPVQQLSGAVASRTVKLFQVPASLIPSGTIQVVAKATAQLQGKTLPENIAGYAITGGQAFALGP